MLSSLIEGADDVFEFDSAAKSPFKALQTGTSPAFDGVTGDAAFSLVQPSPPLEDVGPAITVQSAAASSPPDSSTSLGSGQRRFRGETLREVLAWFYGRYVVECLS